MFLIDFDDQGPRAFMHCLERYDTTSLERYDDTQYIIIFANAMLAHVTNNY